MRPNPCLTLAVLLAGLALPAEAQQDRQRPGVPPVDREDGPRVLGVQRGQAVQGEPDVLLDVPNLSVDKIELEVNNLTAKLNLDARLANMLQLSAGADVGIEHVRLTIEGVQAQVLLVVRLDNVARILDRTLTTIDRNPEILTRLLETVDHTVGTVGDVAGTALQPGGVVDRAVGAVGQTLDNVTRPDGVLSQTVSEVGRTVRRTVDETGNVIEYTADRSGRVTDARRVGSVRDMEVVNERSGRDSQRIQRVRDPETGAVMEVTLDRRGNVVSVRVVQQGRSGS